ncbi:MAG: BON domain-containing protein [bacterium]
MKSTKLDPVRSGLAMAGIVASLMLTACGSGAGSKTDSKDATASSTASANSAVVVGSPSPATVVPRTVDNQAASRMPNNDNRGASSGIKPQLGTGGSDLFLFTQVRGLLNSDAELKTANIIIDAHAGVVTLSGTVANASLKTKAEQLVRAVGGVKKLKNNLRVSS